MEFAGTGSVISWNEERGYGFIRDSFVTEKDLFAHAKDMPDGSVRKVGAQVSYQVVGTSKGFQAVRICPQPQEAAAAEECDVLTEEEFRREMALLGQQMVSVDAFLAAARKHGWIEG